MTYDFATTSERVRTDKSIHCACARMRDMRYDESWTGRKWDHHSGVMTEGQWPAWRCLYRRRGVER